MFVTISNYPPSTWTKEQLDAASKYGEIKFIPFPNINGKSTNDQIENYVRDYLDEILKLKPDAVCVAGEWSFTFMLIVELLKRKILVVTPCSKRDAIEKKNEKGNPEKVSYYRFLYYRKMCLLDD